MTSHCLLRQVMAEARRARAAGEVNSTLMTSLEQGGPAKLPGSTENPHASKLANVVQRLMYKKHREAKNMGVNWRQEYWNPKQ